MNGILQLEEGVPDSQPVSPDVLSRLLAASPTQPIKVDDILPILLPPEVVNPFNDATLAGKVPSRTPPAKEDIDRIARLVETLIQQRKCKSQGICEIRNEIYLETLNEIIRQISIDCPERGVLLALIRNEIT